MSLPKILFPVLIIAIDATITGSAHVVKPKRDKTTRLDELIEGMWIDSPWEQTQPDSMRKKGLAWLHPISEEFLKRNTRDRFGERQIWFPWHKSALDRYSREIIQHSADRSEQQKRLYWPHPISSDDDDLRKQATNKADNAGTNRG